MASKTIEASEPQSNPARVLVVDDNSTNRLKMRMAVRKLGHQAELAPDGAKALEMLDADNFDAILLDIMMPVMDGFDVLRALNADESKRDIPVIVISALDDDSVSVVKAIELGAEDFLPKDFDPVLLNARLGASLTKKRFRDQEKEYFQRVEKLTEAAAVLEAGRFTPEDLAIGDLANHDDALGKLAAVFRGMAEEIYDRELRMKRAIQTLQGSFLVIAAGVVWGLTPALARMASGLGSNPFGLAVWVNGIAAVFCLSIAAYRGKLLKIRLNELGFYLLWAIIAGIFQRMTTFMVTEHVEVAMLSLIVTLQGFMVFVFAAATNLEKATPRRLAGLLVGLIGVIAVLVTRFDGDASNENLWLLVALLLPLFFAIEVIMLAAKRPEHVDIFTSVGLMMLFSTVMLAPIAYYNGDLMSLGTETGRLEVLVLLMGVGAACSLLFCFHLIATAGAVFASLSAYAMTIAGIVWGMLLLNEALSAIAWAAVIMILIGLYLVGPDVSDNKVVLKRSLVRPANRS